MKRIISELILSSVRMEGKRANILTECYDPFNKPLNTLRKIDIIKLKTG